MQIFEYILGNTIQLGTCDSINTSVIVMCVSPGIVFPAHISLGMRVSLHIRISLGMRISHQ